MIIALLILLVIALALGFSLDAFLRRVAAIKAKFTKTPPP